MQSMSAKITPNYPDILGALTGGPRCNIHVIQLALAVRPRVVRAGRPFEAILIVQNASDVNVDVTATLHLPERDAKKQKDQFTSHHTRLLVGLHPAEVGYVTLPVGCATTTAIHEGYKLSMTVQVKALSKPQRIRHPQGGGEISGVTPEQQVEIDALSKLYFSTEKSFSLTDTLEVTFGVMPGRLGQLVDTRPGWVSLWTMAHFSDHTALFDTYAPLLAENVLPKLKTDQILEPLLKTTQAQFEAAGYALKPVEALMVAKMLTRVLQLADPLDNLNDYMADHVYNVLNTIKTRDQMDPDSPVALPHWCKGMLHNIAHNRETANHPVRAVCQLLYHDLIRDAVPLAARLIQNELDLELGTEDEVNDYAAQLVSHLKEGSGLDFEMVYMPLILGGIIIGGRVIRQKERLDDTMRTLQTVLEERRAEQTEHNAPLFDIATQLLDRYSQQFSLTL
jgi:hypothetical protein